MVTSTDVVSKGFTVYCTCSSHAYLSLAVAYECTRTITSIYPDKGLIDKAVRCVGVFLVAKTNDIKYMGECFSGLKIVNISRQEGDNLAVQTVHTLPETLCLDEK